MFRCDITNCKEYDCNHGVQCGLCILTTMPTGASVNMAITKMDDDGLYYLVVEDTPFDEKTQEFPTVLMAFHNSVVENSDIPWEIFKAKMDGEFENKG